MADRVFPNSVKGKIDSKQIFTGINWEKVEGQVNKLRQAKASFDIGPVLEGVNQITTLDEEGQERVKNLLSSYAKAFRNEKTAQLFVRKLAQSDKFEEDLDEFENLTLGDPTDHIDDYIGMEEEDEELVTEDAPEEDTLIDDEYVDTASVASARPKKTAAALKNKMKKTKTTAPKTTVKKTTSNIQPNVRTRRVVAFTSSAQLTAEAIEAAVASGDDELKNTILAARHQRRVAIAQRIENARRAVTAQEQSISDNQKKKKASGLIKEAQNILDQHLENEDISDEVGFKAVEDLTESERLSFSKIAERQGFPKEYVNFMMTEGNDPSDEALQIIELINSDNLSREAKASAVKSMVKTATLNTGDVNYLRNYWLNVLGYDDPAAKEWVEALFTTKYNRKERDED